MITNYYTLKALAREWAPLLAGAQVADAFSQARDELTLGLVRGEAEWTLRVSVGHAFHYLFLAPGHSRARRNVATLFAAAVGRAVAGVRIADRDRVLYLDLAGGRSLQIHLFGPRANVFLTAADGEVIEAFQANEQWAGGAAPAARPAPRVDSFEAFERRWRPDRPTTEQALSGAFPLFDRVLAAEAAFRAGVTAAAPGTCSASDRQALYEAARDVEAALDAPDPCLYGQEDRVDLFALLPLHHRSDAPIAVFEEVGEGVRRFVRQRLALQRFEAVYRPLEKALETAGRRSEAQVEKMLAELARESRADQYERWGHLLMASMDQVPPGAEEAALPDWFGGGLLTVPLDPARSAVENAERYYDKARKTRQARAHAEQRLLETEDHRQASARLLGQLRSVRTLRELEQFRQIEAEALDRLAGDAAAEEARLPFRRFVLGGGYEAWAGKNAKQNDQLTFRYARKYDLWLHARGVPGAHVVLRRPHRDAQPGKPLLEAAAGIAAYYSEARGSEFVPVQVAECKYVRRLKGAHPGAVRVDRESVLLVEPRLPDPP